MMVWHDPDNRPGPQELLSQGAYLFGLTTAMALP